MITKPLRVRTARRDHDAFTLAELLVSMAVIAIIIFMVAQLMGHASAVTRTGSKRIDTDTEARTVLDRMAVDFRQMLKRTDIDYYVKGPVNYTGHGNGHAWGRKIQTGQEGSDQIAFFSQVSGYDPSQGSPSPLSLVAYRVNGSDGTNNSAAYLRLERMGKRLIWNSKPPSGNASNRPIPIAFLPITISTMSPDAVSPITYDNNPVTSSYETIGPDVFRFEYCYLIKTSGTVTDVPWDRFGRPNQTTLTNPQSIGLGDVQAIGVTIAVIDPASRALINAAGATSLFDLASDMADFTSANGRGFGSSKSFSDLQYLWNAVLVGNPTQIPPLPGVISTGMTSNNTPVPPAAAKAIRIYTRIFDLRTL